jgi:hypothetical protein
MAATHFQLAPASMRPWPNCFNEAPNTDPFAVDGFEPHDSFDVDSELCNLVASDNDEPSLETPRKATCIHSTPRCNDDTPVAPSTPSKNRATFPGAVPSHHSLDNRSEASSDASDWCMVTHGLDLALPCTDMPADAPLPPLQIDELPLAPQASPLRSLTNSDESTAAETVEPGAENAPPDDAAAPSVDTELKQQQYVLVRLDTRGRILRQATQDDIELLSTLLHKQSREKSLCRAKARIIGRRGGSTAGSRKPGGPCCHCNTTGAPAAAMLSLSRKGSLSLCPRLLELAQHGVDQHSRALAMLLDSMRHMSLPRRCHHHPNVNH